MRKYAKNADNICACQKYAVLCIEKNERNICVYQKNVVLLQRKSFQPFAVRS